jgi:simple sugar transport system ATP-binding protein
MSEDGRDGAPLLEARSLSKRFGRIEAVRDVSLALGRAEVLALLGDNGAGKSTLIKILTGLYPPDRGELRWEGRPVRFGSPRDAYELGIATVYQDLAVVDLMSVYRNMFLGREDAITRRFGPFRWLDRGRARREAREALAAIGINIRSADEPVARMSGGERQSIAIARGIHFSAKLLILDEPTSALSLKQSAQVLKSIEGARDTGLGVIVISHNVHHVYPVADRFVILSHGQSIADFKRGERTKEEVSDLIVQGRELAQQLREVEAAE